MLRRIEQTGQVAAGRFPVFADPRTGEWACRRTAAGPAGSGSGAAAERIVDALAGRHLAPHGGLRDGCYDQRRQLATASELIWGDYFLLEAVLGLDGVIKSGTL